MVAEVKTRPRPKVTEEWTINSLKEYFEMRFDNMESSLDARFEAQEKATSVANQASDKRLEGMNEFRESLREQSTAFATKSEVCKLEDIITVKLDAINKNLQKIEISDATLAGKASQNSVIGAYILSIIMLIISILKLFMK
jgi:hypothetical protein